MSFSKSNELLDYLKEQYYINTYYKENIIYSNILDSSLISQSNRKAHDIKFVKCGDYLQIYFYSKTRYATDKNMELIQTPIHLLTENTVKHVPDEYKPQKIEEKNINRSKIMLQQIIKTNEHIFKTFITLTFAENITDVKEANKKFNIWRRNIKRLKPDFAYVCVPEFQTRGAVHYHLMTNIEYMDFKLLSQEERKIYKPGSGWQVGRDIKGWIYGHNMVKNMDSINLVGYITKYMTKDIDDRLFSKHRFFYSQNLEKPEEIMFDLKISQDKSLYVRTTQYNYILDELTYLKKYEDIFGDTVVFCEYKIKKDDFYSLL